MTLISFCLATCKQKDGIKLTVVFFDNQNPNSNVTIDTLLKSKKIGSIDGTIDIFFACKNFHLPYYVPTEGIYKNAAKDKECDMKIYPNTVKCYEYDDKHRVIKMTVNGSGTTNSFAYSYNDKNQIKEVTDWSSKLELTYNANGTLAELKQTKPFDKKLVFIYE